MIILVDYDNIDKQLLRRGISYVVSRIFSKIDPTDIVGRNVKVRLYGGWYQSNAFTTRAQNLSADISSSFPNTVLLSDNTTSVIVNCEMAYSILADPSNHLFDTFRVRGIPTGLHAQHPTSCGCPNFSCPIIATYNFITNNICTTCNIVTPEQLLYRSEQKLIDTMLTSDLIFSSLSTTNLVIVSSDDDFWPGIRTTLSSGAKVIQIHTRRRQTPLYYSQTANRTNYIQKQL